MLIIYAVVNINSIIHCDIRIQSSINLDAIYRQQCTYNLMNKSLEANVLHTHTVNINNISHYDVTIKIAIYV